MTRRSCWPGRPADRSGCRSSRRSSAGQATTAQFQLDRRARAANVAGAFRVSSGRAPAAIRGRWVVLVDDVMTTGATLSACAAALLEGGAQAVSAVTVARER